LKTLIPRILFVTMFLCAILPLRAQTPEAQKAEARATLNSGVAAFKNGNPQAAIDSFTRALQLDPDFVEAELYLASAYASMVKPGPSAAQNQEIGRKAIESFEHVLQKQPDNANAIAGLAEMYASTGNLGKSREMYLRLTKSSPQNSTAFYSVAATDWLLAFNKTNPLPEADKVRLIDEGLQHVDIALSLNPQYVDAMAYKNLLLRMKADTTQDASERARLLGEADSWFSKALQARSQNPTGGNRNAAAPPPPPPPPPPPSPQSIPPGAVRVGGDVAQGNLINQVRPVYPEPARAARIQGVVLLQTAIDKTGQVVGLSVLSGHPLLNDAAVEAVRQWRYQPILLNGQPVDVVTTVTVNFVFQ